MVEAEVVHEAEDEVVDELLDRLGPVVEAGHGRDDHRAGVPEAQQVFEVDRVQRRLARDEHEAAPLLETDVRGPVDEVCDRARRERAHGRHAAWDHDHAVDRVGAGRDRRADVVCRQQLDLLGGTPREPLDERLAGARQVELLREHAPARRAYDQVHAPDLVAPVQVPEEPRGVDRPARPRDRHRYRLHAGDYTRTVVGGQWSVVRTGSDH